MMGPHRGAPTPRKPGCCPSRGAGSCRTGIRVRLCRGRPADAPPRAPLAAVPGGRGGNASGQDCFPPSGWLGRRQLRRQGRWKRLLQLCCYLWRREEKWGKKRQKAAMRKGQSDAPVCSPLRSQLRPAPSCRIPSQRRPGPPELCHGVVPGTGGWRGLEAGESQRGGRELPPPHSYRHREGPGAHTEGCARVAGGPCWVSGPAPHSRGLETCPGSGAGLGAAAKIFLLLPPRCGTLSSGAEAVDPIPRVLHPPVPGTRSPLVPIPAPNAPCAGQGRLDPQLIRVLRSIFGYQNNPPAPPGFQAMLSLAVQPRADYTAERPRLPAGMLLSVILVIVSRNHRHAAPRDPWRLQRGVPGGGSPTGTPHQTHRLQDGEPRGVFCNTTALGSKKHSFFAFSAPWHAQCPQLSSVMGRWEAGAE